LPDLIASSVCYFQAESIFSDELIINLVIS